MVVLGWGVWMGFGDGTRLFIGTGIELKGLVLILTLVERGKNVFCRKFPVRHLPALI